MTAWFSTSSALNPVNYTSDQLQIWINGTKTIAQAEPAEPPNWIRRLILYIQKRLILFPKHGKEKPKSKGGHAPRRRLWF
jgi:hypothetical protein